MRGVKFFLAFSALALFLFYLNSSVLYAPKIYDSFLLYNEIDLLELRLEEMASSVDKFVIVEAEETFRGVPKPLHFPSHTERFRKFADKIIYVPVRGHFETDSPWKRERYQRDQILKGLKGCHRKDIVLISDLDEIVRREKIPEITSALLGNREVVVLSQRMYFGYVNRFQGLWKGTVATSYGQLKRLSPKIVRKLRHMKPKRLRSSGITRALLIQEGGWHFSSLGGVESYRDKIRAFSHSELDNEEYTREENLAAVLQRCPLVSLDGSFPSYLQSNEAHFRAIGFIDSDHLGL